jgi:hypothetical protein
MTSPDAAGRDEAILNEMRELSRGLSDERAQAVMGSVIDAVALNPQPLPPKVQEILGSVIDAVALNPQPIPPGIEAVLRAVVGSVSLNPQPEPPGASPAG